jgi:hypothetical protein
MLAGWDEHDRAAVGRRLTRLNRDMEAVIRTFDAA